MSSYPPVESTHSNAQAESPGKGLAIAAIVCGVLFVFAPIGLILGIIALVQSSKPGKSGARGLAIGGTIASGIGIFLCCVAGAGIMLPSLGQARNSARQLKSATQLRAISTGLQLYAQNFKDQFPPAGSNWEAILTQQGVVTGGMFISPASQANLPSYFFVPPGGSISKIQNPSATVLAFEDPVNFRQRSSNVLFIDGHIEFLTGPDLWSKIDGLILADGSTYKRPAGSK